MNHKDRERVTAFENLLHEHGERLARIEEKNKNQYKMLKEIDRNLFGDGGEGIIQTITEHKTYFKIMGATIGMLTGAIITIIIKILL